MSNDGNPVPGWHPDPYGRHQHRFWDGTAWTGRVADDGNESDDPIPAAPPAPPVGPTPVEPAGSPAPSGPPTGWEPTPSTPAAPPSPRASNGRRWFVMGAAALVTAAIVVALVLVLAGNSSGGPSLGTGAGTFTATVDKGDAKVRTVSMQAGDLITVAWKAQSGDAHVAMAVDRTTGEKLAGKSGLLTDSDLSQSFDTAHSLLSDNNDSAKVFQNTTRLHPYVKVDGFEGIVAGDADAFLTPRSGTFAVIVVGDTKTTVKVRITVKHLSKTGKDLNSSQYDSFTSDLDSSQLDTEFNNQCTSASDLSEGLCASLSDSGDSSDSGFSS